MAEYPYIDAQIIDTDLFSGSADTFRTAYGGFYEEVEGETDAISGETSTEIEQIRREDSAVGFAYNLFGYFDDENIETIDEDILVANRKIPMRVFSNSELISNDVFWKTVWIGGEFGDVTYSPIYNEIVHSFYNSDYELPYPQIEANAFSSDTIESTIEISYDYSAYLPQYEEYISELDSELLIPNYYIMFDMVTSDIAEDEDSDEKLIDASLYSPELISYITAETNYQDVLTFFDFNWAKVPGGMDPAGYEDGYGTPPEDTAVSKGDLAGNFVTRNSYLSTEFLTASYIQNPLSSSTREWVEDHLQNLLFDEDAVEAITSTGTSFSTDAEMLPYKIKINFNEFEGSPAVDASGDSLTDSTATFADSIRDNDFSSRFIKTLYKAFDNKLDDLAPNDVEYITWLNYSSASIEDEAEYNVSTANNTTYREIDYVSFLAYCYNNYISSDEGCLFVGPNTIERLSATDEKGTYRHINTQAALGVLTDTVEYLAGETNIGFTAASHVFPSTLAFATLPSTTPSFGDSSEPSSEASTDFAQSYVEPLAYRVEKIGGPPSGDSFTQNTIQNFWFFKPEETDHTFTFYDSQVKYDTEYTYKVYAYALTVGYRYKYSDLALTRNIGCEGADGEYGLEFYDPYSDDEETTSRLYEGSRGDNILVSAQEAADATLVSTESYTFADDEDEPWLEDGAAWEAESAGNYYETEQMTATLMTVYFYSPAIFAGSVYGTDAQIFSTYPYAADFYFNYEPGAKIIEIPLYEKTLKVLDNPTNKLNIVPYQVEGNSQKIGFNCLYTSFVEKTFPTIISADDQEYRDAYIHANDLFEDSYLDYESISLQRYVEVYRLSSRPTAITDFDGAKIAEVDLAVENLSQYSYKGSFYDDTIKTNQKYYYLFRILNQQRNLSHLTEIIEAELINDGGYKYAIFNILYEYELEQEVFNEPSQTFKKLIQLQPNLEQLQFNIDDIDYNQSAASQIDNLIIGDSEDSIWDKTFKVRLTSKKTSRKIDLNITYRLNSD